MLREMMIGLLLLGMLVLSVGCAMVGVRGSGHVVEEERAVKDFTSLENATFGDVIITVGDEESLKIEAEDNLLPYLHTEVHNGKLVISTESGTIFRHTQPVKFYVTVKSLDAVILTGSGSIDAPELTAKSFDVRLAGSGDVNIDGVAADNTEINLAGSGSITVGQVDGDALEVSIPGSGNVNIEGGAVDQQTVTIMGSGNYRGSEMSSDSASAQVMGSGSVTLAVKESLDGSIMGSGNIYYSGRPKVDSRIAGSGRMSQLGD